MLGRTLLCWMKVLSTANEEVAGGDPATETLLLSARHLEYLARESQKINPAMPNAFGCPHVIRTLLDRIEASGIDLTAASSEAEIAELVTAKLETRSRRRTAFIGRLCASVPLPSAARLGCQSNLPARGRYRSGKPPR